MNLTEKEKWEAVVSCNAGYDGKFFYGVITTKIFCRPSCKSKTPLRSNVKFFDTREDAMRYGLRPCKRCRPDLIKYEPMTELMKQAKSIYEMYFSDNIRLEKELKGLKISKNHFIRLFSQEFGVTPNRYLSGLRLNEAIKLLKKTGISILQVAIISGFGNITSFYTCFRKELGCTPGEYRKR